MRSGCGLKAGNHLRHVHLSPSPGAAAAQPAAAERPSGPGLAARRRDHPRPWPHPPLPDARGAEVEAVAASTSTSRRASSSPSSGPTAPASPRACACSPRCSPPTAGTARGRRPRRPAPSPGGAARASATSGRAPARAATQRVPRRARHPGRLLRHDARRRRGARPTNCSTRSTSSAFADRKRRARCRAASSAASTSRSGSMHAPDAAVPRRAVHRPRPAEPGEPLGAHRRLRAEHGTTVFLTTHYLDEADTHRRARHGRWTTDGSSPTTPPTASRPSSPATGSCCGVRDRGGRRAPSPPPRRGERGRDGAHARAAAAEHVPAPEAPRSCPAADRPRRRRRCAPATATSRPTLDDVFLALTGRTLREAGGPAKSEPQTPGAEP